MNPKKLPDFMKAAQGKSFGEIDEMLNVEGKVPVPNLHAEYEPSQPIHPLVRFATRRDRKTHIIIKTLAVALAPGDCRVLSGKTRELQGPPSFPYIPGGDCCGVVVQTQEVEKYFKPGDVVAARFTVAPRDAMAEYARISATVCEKVDTSKISPEEAAALASASAAVCLSDYVKPNERILVLGASGGVGSHFVQLARERGASYICGVSSSPAHLLSLGCDDAIDYTEQNVFESTKFQEEQFDSIYDLACGGWPQLVDAVRNNTPSIVKSARMGGRFISLTPDSPTFEGHSLWSLLSLFLFLSLFRAVSSQLFTRKTLPIFSSAACLPDTREIMTRTLDLAQAGKYKAVIDNVYPFTTEGVRSAFHVVESRHGKGKVVVKIADL